MNPILYPAIAKNVSSLGRREEVLRCMWAGRGTKEIAAELGLSPKTVEYHRAKLYQLFGVQDPVSLCRRAMEAGILEPRTEVQNRRRVGAGSKQKSADVAIGHPQRDTFASRLSHIGPKQRTPVAGDCKGSPRTNSR